MKDISEWIDAIDERRRAISVERDKLDDMIGEMQSLRDVVDEARENLDLARDALSQLV